ncbi:MAG: hypothetical protein ACYDBB_10015 [Armatimonadota bacterium]
MVTYTPVAPQGMSPFGDWFNELFRLWAARWQVWVLQGLIFILPFIPLVIMYFVFLFSMVFTSAAAGRNSQPPEATFFIFIGLFYLLFFLAILLIHLFIPGMVITALKQIRGQEITVSDIFSGMRYFWGALLVSLVTYLGLLLCGVGLIATEGLFFLAVPLMVDRQLRTSEALSVSWNTTKTNFWLYVLFALVISFLSRMGGMACYVGFIATLPFFYIGQAVAYERTFNGPAATFVNPGYGTVPPPPYIPQDVPRRVSEEQEKPQEPDNG